MRAFEDIRTGAAPVAAPRGRGSRHALSELPAGRSGLGRNEPITAEVFLRPTSIFTRLSAIAVGGIWACAGAYWTHHVVLLGAEFPTEETKNLCFVVLAAGLLLIASALLPSKPRDFESVTPDLHTDLDRDD